MDQHLAAHRASVTDTDRTAVMAHIGPWLRAKYMTEPVLIGEFVRSLELSRLIAINGVVASSEQRITLMNPEFVLGLDEAAIGATFSHELGHLREHLRALVGV